MFLMDSVNAGKRNSRKALEFIHSVIDEFDIEHDNIHVGLLSAECEGETPGFQLGSHQTRHQLETHFRSMNGTDFHKILHSMRRGSFSKSGRKHTKKIAILIIDGSLEEPLKTLSEAQKAKIHGIEVYVVLVSDVFSVCSNISVTIIGDAVKENVQFDLPGLWFRAHKIRLYVHRY